MKRTAAITKIDPMFKVSFGSIKPADSIKDVQVMLKKASAKDRIYTFCFEVVEDYDGVHIELFGYKK